MAELDHKQCTNCDKMIDASKLDLHEAYCVRNIVKCKDCNKPIDKSELNQHILEEHTKVYQACNYCQKQLEKQLIGKHMIACDQKPKQCTFCELQLPPQQYSDHVYNCGSRTKQCPSCKKNIIMRDFSFHEGSCIFEMEQEAIRMQSNPMKANIQAKWEKNFPQMESQSQAQAQNNPIKTNTQAKWEKNIPQVGAKKESQYKGKYVAPGQFNIKPDKYAAQTSVDNQIKAPIGQIKKQTVPLQEQKKDSGINKPKSSKQIKDSIIPTMSTKPQEKKQQQEQKQQQQQSYKALSQNEQDELFAKQLQMDLDHGEKSPDTYQKEIDQLYSNNNNKFEEKKEGKQPKAETNSFLRHDINALPEYNDYNSMNDFKKQSSMGEEFDYAGNDYEVPKQENDNMNQGNTNLGVQEEDQAFQKAIEESLAQKQYSYIPDKEDYGDLNFNDTMHGESFQKAMFESMKDNQQKSNSFKK